MKCLNCGTELENGAAFCAKCGTPVPQPINEVQNKNFGQNFVQSQATGNIENALKKEKKKVTVMLIVLIVSLVLLLITIIVAAGSSTKYVEAEQLNILTAREGEYVTTDLMLIEPFYETYTEENGIKTSTNYYHCFAIDTNHNTFIVKVPYVYYTETLSVLENNSDILDGDENTSLESVTVYGTVKAVDSDVASSITDYYSDSNLDFLSLFTDYQVDLYTSPKKENGGAFIFALLLGIVSLIILFSFFKVRSKYKKAVRIYNDYGDVE